MAFASFLMMWLAMLSLCLLFAVRPWTLKKAGLALENTAEPSTASLPLVVLCGMILTACTAGCFGLLKIGVWVILAAALGALLWTGYALYQAGPDAAKQRLRGCLTPAWCVAFGGSLLLALFLAWQQPMPTQWDEFSFWATAAKVVKNNDALYTMVVQTNQEARSYPAALPVLSYLFQWMAPAFTPWLMYAAYGTLYFVVFGAMVGLLGKENVRGAVFAALGCVLAPIAIESWYPQQTLVAYTTAYADLMLGLLNAGGCAVWFIASRSNAKGPLMGRAYGAALFQTALVILTLGLTKDVGLPLGLVVMFVCLLDHFACDFLRNPKDAKAWARLFGVLFILTAAAAISYFGWAAHMGTALGIDRSDTGGSAQMGTVEMVICGIQELLGINRSEKFAAVLSAMLGAFRGIRVSVFGNGLRTILAIGLILVLAFCLEQKNKRRVVCYGLASGLGFVGYYFFQLICYVYVFSEADGLGLVSYERYMSTYYLFWLLGALCVLFCAVRSGHRFAGVSLAAVSLVVLLLCGRSVQVQNTFLGRNKTAWYTESLIQARADQASAVAQPGDKVLLVSQWDDSARWYRYAYALESVPLYHARGDNTIVLPGTEGDYPLTLSADTIDDFMQENGCTLLLLDVVDYDFWNEFRGLFTDEMEGFLQNGQAVYRLESVDGIARFVPEQEAAR